MKSPLKLIIPLLGLLVVVLSACGGDDNRPVVVSGRSLEIHAERPIIVEKVAFQDTLGEHRIIRPRASNRQLVLINTTVVNRTSLVTPLLIDSSAAQLGDRRGQRVDALNPFEASRVIDSADPEEDMYAPFLWGETELDRNFQIGGYLLFDVPKGLILGSLWWEEVDAIVADFIDYRTRRR